MCDESPSNAIRSRRWPRFSLRQLGLFFVLLSVCLTLAMRFGPHVMWRLSERGRSLPGGPPTPVRDMPSVEVPEDWVSLTFDGLHFALPPDLAAAKVVDIIDANTTAQYFEHDTVRIALTPPTYRGWIGDFWRRRVPKLPEESASELSDVELLAEILPASADDFRWTMSHAELKRHQWRLEESPTWYPGENCVAETLAVPSLEAILYYSEQYAYATWYSTDGEFNGSIVFGPVGEHPLDVNFLRTVCHSLKWEKVNATGAGGE